MVDEYLCFTSCGFNELLISLPDYYHVGERVCERSRNYLRHLLLGGILRGWWRCKAYHTWSAYFGLSLDADNCSLERARNTVVGNSLLKLRMIVLWEPWTPSQSLLPAILIDRC